MSFKSVLKPEGSVIAGLATVAVVYGVYQLNVGTVAQAQATEANHPVLNSTRRKAGFTSLVFVAALTLITKDANIGILGGGTIIAMELGYRHGIMSDPQSNRLVAPNARSYDPAENVVPFPMQGETA